jgi:hypothetical protein
MRQVQSNSGVDQLGARDLLPNAEGPRAEQAVVLGTKQMPTIVEQILNPAVQREKTLGLVSGLGPMGQTRLIAEAEEKVEIRGV